MSAKFTLYGWHLSYFTGKVLCYLRYKGIPFVDQPVNMYTLMSRIKRKTGAAVMPVLRTPQDEWLQDSSVIIDHLEALYPAAPIIPATPVQRFLAYLLEAWGDEWWIPVAMHTRWNHAENYALFERDAGSALLPHFPSFLQRKAVANVAGMLRRMLPNVGIRPEQNAVLDAWTDNMLNLLERHFAEQPFLLGGHPTLADFGLVGTMYGHLGRDPWPARELIAPRPHLRAWIERMANPSAPGTAGQPLLADDGIAPTLLPILQVIFAEFVPWIAGIGQQVSALRPTFAPGKPLPRVLADVDVSTDYGLFRRPAMPFSLWMAQRTLDVYQQMPAAERALVAGWLAEHGGQSLLDLQLPRLQRCAVRVAFVD